MSTSYTQWADLSTSRENKRRSEELFAGSEATDADEGQSELLSSIQRAVEQERQRIAEDLHDSTAQDVALALHKLEYIQHLLEQSQLYQAFQEVTHVAGILENGLHNLRNSIEALLPREFDKQTVFVSLMTLIQEYQHYHPELQLDCQLELHELLTQLPARLELPIFRFVQQALNNVWQHASATHVVLSFILLSNTLTIEVRDNGGGFSPQADATDHETTAQFGLKIMRKRVEQAGGVWEIKSQPGEGTCVCAVFSL